MKPHENLDNLFEQARKSPPLLDKEEVKQILSSPDPIVMPKRFSSTKIWIVGAAATIVIFGTVYFVSQNNSDPVTKQSLIITDSIKEEPNHPSQIVEEIPLQTSTEKKVETIIAPNKPNSENLVVEKNQSAENIIEEAPIYPGASSGTYPKRVEEDKSNDGYLHLTNEELAKLGIIMDGSALRYLNKTDTTKLSETIGAKIINRVYVLDLDIDKYGGTRSSNVHKDDSVLQNMSNPAVPLIVSIVNEKKTDMRYWVNEWKFSQDYKDKYISDMKLNLVPVVVHTKGKHMIYSHDNELVFWF